MKFLQRVRSSVRSGSPYAVNEPDDPRKYLRNFLLHFRPQAVPERTLLFSFTWGLGVASVTLLVLLVATGFMLKFVYEPTPALAYDSILYLGSEVPFGQLLRNMHRWSGYALLVASFLHFLRVYYTGAFHPPRQFNWVIGLVLLFAVALSNFTGYLLPWDQVSYWAVTISTSMLDYVPWAGTPLKSWILGGSEPGPATLMNFYALHTAVIPWLLLFALSFHFWRIRKANGLAIPRGADEAEAPLRPMVDTLPHVVTREVALALLVTAAVLAVSMVFNAPLAEQANPGMSPNPTKAPWYFMGIQEILMHFHPLFAALVIPGLLLLGLLLIPYLAYDADTAGVWFCSRTGRRTALVAAAAAVALTVAGVLLDEFVLSAGVTEPPGVLRNGLLPFAVVAAVCAGFYLFVRKAFDANRNEAVQALFTLLMASFVTLTIIGIWFRGQGMQLAWGI